MSINIYGEDGGLDHNLSFQFCSAHNTRHYLEYCTMAGGFSRFVRVIKEDYLMLFHGSTNEGRFMSKRLFFMFQLFP